jgi:DNA mismatch repair ATPase MutS
MSGASSLSRTGSTSLIPLASLLFTAVFYFQSMFNNLEMATTLHKVTKMLAERARGLAAFQRAAAELLQLPEAAPALAAWFPESCPDALAGHTPSNCGSQVHLLTPFGRELAWLKGLDQEAFAARVRRVYMLDALGSVLRLVDARGLCFAAFDARPDPHLTADGMWHPSLPDCTVVRNSLALPPSALVTGPNAAGKSSCLKALLIDVMLAQTLTVAFARALRLAPFHHIDSQVAVADDKERASLFEAECLRCSSILKQLDRNPNRRHLVVIDELLSSTNPLDGISAAYAVAQALGQHPNCCAVISTHYTYLTRLAKSPEAQRPFQNLCMRATVLPDGTIRYPYRLCKGVSHRSIGIEVMRHKGLFDDTVLEAAMQVRDRFHGHASDRHPESKPKLTNT